MRRHLRRAALLAVLLLGLGNSTCRASSNTSNEGEKQGKGSEFEAAVVMAFPGLPTPAPVIVFQPARR
jgi:hypothetical protein